MNGQPTGPSEEPQRQASDSENSGVRSMPPAADLERQWRELSRRIDEHLENLGRGSQ